MVLSCGGGTTTPGAGGACIVAGVCGAAELDIAASTLPKYRPETRSGTVPAVTKKKRKSAAFRAAAPTRLYRNMLPKNPRSREKNP